MNLLLAMERVKARNVWQVSRHFGGKRTKHLLLGGICFGRMVRHTCALILREFSYGEKTEKM